MSRVYRFKRDKTGKIFSFTSVGIIKLNEVVTFKSYDIEYYNIVLQTELNGILLPDTEISNNGDARKVFSTTAVLLIIFLFSILKLLCILQEVHLNVPAYTITYLLQNLRQEIST